MTAWLMDFSLHKNDRRKPATLVRRWGADFQLGDRWDSAPRGREEAPLATSGSARHRPLRYSTMRSISSAVRTVAKFCGMMPSRKPGTTTSEGVKIDCLM